jgi:hypothetical protein
MKVRNKKEKKWNNNLCKTKGEKKLKDRKTFNYRNKTQENLCEKNLIIMKMWKTTIMLLVKKEYKLVLIMVPKFIDYSSTINYFSYHYLLLKVLNNPNRYINNHEIIQESSFRPNVQYGIW